jgi:HEAT repeat protein
MDLNGLLFSGKRNCRVPHCTLVATWLSVLLGTLWLAAGCNFAQEKSASTLGARDSSAISADDATGDQEFANPSPRSASGATQDTHALLAESEWVQRIESTPTNLAEAAGPSPRRRWRHAGLESLVAQSDARAQLRFAARSNDAAVAATANIGLASLGESRTLPGLIKAAHDSRLKLPARGAAIEAIGGLTTPKADDAIDELLAALGDFRGPAKPRYLPELHADLIRAIGARDPNRHAQAMRIALSSPASAVRLEAIQAHARVDVPAPRELVDCTADQSSAVRAAAIVALAEAQHEEAQACVWRALSDYDLTVRLAAIEALGKLPGSDNTTRLHALAADSADTIRAAAVESLARRGESAAVAGAAKDTSWRVRAAVADNLHTMTAQKREPLARAFLADASLEVQRRMVRALAAWPLEDAVPLLLAAIEGPTAATRRDAADLLQKRWREAAKLSPQSPRERLAAEAARLREIWQSRPAIEVQPEQATALEGRRTDAAASASTLEIIEQLTADSVQDRRAAVRTLATEYRERVLAETEILRIAELAERESDPLVWNELLSLVARDERAPAVDIAAIAASHPNAEVRRRACAYFAQHPSRRAADVLQNCVTDEDATVVREALRGLSNQRQIPNAGSLESLLTASDSGVRIAAAAALARHGSPAGVRAILRLCHHQDSVVRRQAAAALADAFQLAEPSKNSLLDDSLRNAAVGELVRLLDDNGDVRRAALASLQRIVRDPPPPASDSAEQVRRWKRWHASK